MRAVGIDISHWQTSFTPQGNIDFVIQKVSEGTTADPAFKELLKGTSQIERRGAYHYFRTGIDPVAQAEFFNIQQGNQGFKFLAVDYEKTNNALDATGAVNLLKFWFRLAMLTTKPIVLYTSPYIYRDNLCAYNETWKEVPVWMAHYNGLDPQTGAPQTFGLNDWTFWQYTDQGNGAEYGVISNNVDLNVFNGTVAELDAWLGIEEEPISDCAEDIANLKIAYASLLAKTKTLEQGQIDAAESQLAVEDRVKALEGLLKDTILPYVEDIPAAVVELNNRVDDAFVDITAQAQELEDHIERYTSALVGHNGIYERIEDLELAVGGLDLQIKDGDEEINRVFHRVSDCETDIVNMEDDHDDFVNEVAVEFDKAYEMISGMDVANIEFANDINARIDQAIDDHQEDFYATSHRIDGLQGGHNHPAWLRKLGLVK